FTARDPGPIDTGPAVDEMLITPPSPLVAFTDRLDASTTVTPPAPLLTMAIWPPLHAFPGVLTASTLMLPLTPLASAPDPVVNVVSLLAVMETVPPWLSSPASPPVALILPPTKTVPDAAERVTLPPAPTPAALASSPANTCRSPRSALSESFAPLPSP